MLEALSARARQVKKSREQREVAFGLADLSTKPDMHVRMVDKGGVRALIRILERSPDLEAQRFSALALGNVASTHENKAPLVDEGLMRPLLEYTAAEQGDIIAKQYCCLYLGNLLSEPENHDEFVKLEGLEVLVGMVKHEVCFVSFLFVFYVLFSRCQNFMQANVFRIQLQFISGHHPSLSCTSTNHQHCFLLAIAIRMSCAAVMEPSHLPTSRPTPNSGGTWSTKTPSRPF